MRQWRVGSFSMGSILILLGLGLIIDRFGGTPGAFELVITWWPLALILLGMEILAAGFLSGNEKFKIKYDGWAILLMIVLFFFCLGNYALSASGVIPQVQEALSIAEFTCALPDQEIDLAGIKKVIVSSRESDLELQSVPGGKLTIFGQADIRASSAERAEELARRAEAEIRTVGDTLYIRASRAPGQGNIFRSDYSKTGRLIFVPAGIPLEVSCAGYGGSTILRLDSLEAPWSIDCGGSVRTYLSPDLDLTLTGQAPWSRDNLTGNAEWVYTSDPGSEHGARSATGTIKLGEGRLPLLISSDDRIEVNIQPAR